MIRAVRREDIPACVQVIRKSHQTVADEFGLTPENAPRYVAFATDENRLLWHMDSEHRLMFAEEEAGLTVIPETVKEYGYVHRIQKSDQDAAECFVQDNYYYLCDAEAEPVSQDLDEYEAVESYRLEYTDPATAILKNRNVKDSPYNRMMFEREALVLERLQSEGWLNGEGGKKS